MTYIILTIIALIVVLLLLKTLGKIGFIALILTGLYIASNKK